MKKETVIFGSILAVFLLLMTPNISAINAHSAETEIKERIQHLENTIDRTDQFTFLNSIFTPFFNKIGDIDWFDLIMRIYYTILTIGYISMIISNIISGDLNIGEFLSNCILEGVILLFITIYFNFMLGQNITISKLIAGFIFGVLSPILGLPYMLNIIFYGEPRGPLALFFYNLFRYTIFDEIDTQSEKIMNSNLFQSTGINQITTN